ncbi:MAG TPA: response regulator, partial [Gammaproteobacteria bacterium]|nr:response regulator [Gammaproteobacteria bacterium]
VLYEPYGPARAGLAATLRELGLDVVPMADWEEALGRAGEAGAAGRALLVLGLEGGAEDVPRLRETAGLPETVAVIALVRTFDQAVHMHYRELGAAVSLPKAASGKVLRRQIRHLWGGDAGQEGPAAPPAAGCAGAEVLVVDDSAINRDLVREVLSQRGIRCREAAGGAEAVAAVQQAVPDLVLMDIRMPEVDGLEATRRLRRLQGPAARVPVIALTAYAETTDRATFLQAGVDDVLVKPLQEEALWQVLETWAGCRTGPSTGDEPGARARRADRLLERFVQELAGQLPRLRQAFELGDWEALREEVHRIAGTAAACEVHAVAEPARRLEEALRDPNRSGVESRYTQFMTAADSVVEDVTATDAE